MHADADRLNALTEQIIGCAYRVMNQLGCGFLEKVYENAMVVELRMAGLAVEQQVAIAVRYRGVVVGDYVADLIVGGSVLLEIKAVKALDDIHKAQCLNYLKASGIPICLLMNFGGTPFQLKRLASAGVFESPG